VAGTVFLTAGCGGGGKKPVTKAEYEAQMQPIASRLASTAGALTSATTKKAGIDALTKLEVALTEAAKQLDQITPPANVAKAHAQLTAAASEFATELEPLIAKLRAGAPSVYAVLFSVTSLKGFKALQNVQRAYAAQGYRFSAS
jgi:hypothetical protein